MLFIVMLQKQKRDFSEYGLQFSMREYLGVKTKDYFLFTHTKLGENKNGYQHIRKCCLQYCHVINTKGYGTQYRAPSNSFLLLKDVCCQLI